MGVSRKNRNKISYGLAQIRSPQRWQYPLAKEANESRYPYIVLCYDAENPSGWLSTVSAILGDILEIILIVGVVLQWCMLLYHTAPRRGKTPEH